MIYGNNVYLRLIKEEDLDIFIGLTNDTRETGDHFPYIVRTMSETKNIFYKNGFFDASGGRLLICNYEDKIVGAISYFKTAGYVSGYELGYQIYRQEHRGKGYTSEALKLFSAFLFEHYNISRLQICLEKDNLASEAIAKKCGFQFEGIMRNAWTVRGKMISSQVYSMIREEAPKLKDITKGS